MGSKTLFNPAMQQPQNNYLAVCSDSKRPRSLFMTGGGGGGGEGGHRLENVGGSTKF